jgi:hypothetical protein
MCLPSPFPCASPSSSTSPRQDLFYLPFIFWKKIFLFIYNGYTGSFIVLFSCIYIYMKKIWKNIYYAPNWFITSIFLLSTLVPFLWWFQQVWIFYIHTCIERISTFTLSSSSLSLPSHQFPSLSMTCFYVLVLHCLGSLFIV